MPFDLSLLASLRLQPLRTKVSGLTPLERMQHIIAHKHLLDIPPENGTIETLESDLVGVLARMEQRGILLDTARLRSIGAHIDADIVRIECEVEQAVGERINLASPKQLQVLLFEKLWLKGSKKTKTGYSVDEEVLTELAKSTPIVEKILTHRTLSKLQGTYVEWLLKTLAPNTSRVHTTYASLGAATGRMSSKDPNLQNIPAADSGYAAEIKDCFIAPPGKRLIVADYSQIELRVLAWLSGDSALQEVFLAGGDIHRRTAEFLYHTTDITSDMRRTAKTVNFGVIYGVTAFGLSQQSSLTPAESKVFIDAFFQAYPRVRSYYDGLLQEAQSTLKARTYWGRERLFPTINDANRILRSMAEREVMNMPIQGTAADIVKMAMRELDILERSGKLSAQMLLQVHDELVFEVDETDTIGATEQIRAVMEGIIRWVTPLPLLVDIHVGTSWLKAKKGT